MWGNGIAPGGCVLISASDDDENSSVVTYALQIDPKAFTPIFRLVT